jgi:hypothetical protein
MTPGVTYIRVVSLLEDFAQSRSNGLTAAQRDCSRYEVWSPEALYFLSHDNARMICLRSSERSLYVLPSTGTVNGQQWLRSLIPMCPALVGSGSCAYEVQRDVRTGTGSASRLV